MRKPIPFATAKAWMLDNPGDEDNCAFKVFDRGCGTSLIFVTAPLQRLPEGNAIENCVGVRLPMARRELHPAAFWQCCDDV